MSPPSAPPAPQEEAMNEREGVESRDKREITVRENFEENLFFYPDLVSDEDGKVTFDYQMNDALTTWRMMLFAHDKNLSNGYLEQEIVSRKEIMVTSNQPRFLRSGDQISWTSKIDNLTSSDVHTDVRIELKNALNETSLNHLVDIGRDQQLEISAHASASVAWDITIPADFNFPIEVTIIAQTENHQDAERMTIPVLENRTYLTYTKAIELPADSVMKVDVSQLLKQKSGSSTSERMTIDVTSNPTWYALQALPYLMEYPYDCSEQILNQLYANALGLKLVKDNPQIKKIFNQWSEADKQSPLLKNEAFKISAISQTPWLQDALSQTEQIKRLALLFDSNTLSHQQQSTIQKLMERQSADGGFSWFPGGRSNVYISLYVAKGLQTMRSWLDPMVGAKAEEILSHLLPFLDDQMIRYYESIEQQVRRGHTKWEDNHLDANVIYYLNIRNLKDIAQSDRLRTIQNYFLKQAEKYWTEAALYSQIQLAEVFGILEMSDVRALIVNSFRERRVFKPELGVYWNQDMRWRGWWNMPISIQAGMIKLFTEEGDISLVNDAKRWLLNQKRTNHWSSTIATAEAIEALLMGPSGWIEHSDPVGITINGQELIDSAPGSESSLLHKNFPVIVDRLNQTDEIRATNPNNHPAWAAVYYQFFENLDQVKQDKGELEITRELFLETNTDKGALLRPIKNEILNPGDLIVVRMQLTVDRDMDFVQLKDLRSAGLEPVLTLSGYEWEGGLGFYRSNTDRETNFFIDQLPKGKYVFEYRLRVSQHGNFPGGYATVQSMYAPEFSAHSQGTRLSVKIVK
ncbi:MAG: hypothetical protein KDC53_06220 [Saprospiraceae bacterium]|nr:hypothetical protein [Saprospiraceae bacterium]